MTTKIKQIKIIIVAMANSNTLGYKAFFLQSIKFQNHTSLLLQYMVCPILHERKVKFEEVIVLSQICTGKILIQLIKLQGPNFHRSFPKSYI